MRLGLVAAAIIACIAGAAIAQEQQHPPIQWDELPSARDFGPIYPSRARDQGLAGYSLLCCSIRTDRRLDCEVAVDWPRGHGFADAAQRMAREFRMSEASYATRSGPDERIRRGVVWQIGERTPELEAALAEIHEVTKSTCTPPGVEIAPGADDIIVTSQRIG